VGLNHGLTRIEIEEILLHIAVYAGFPMAMQASREIDERFRILDEVDRLPERPPSTFQGDSQLRAAACEVRQTLTAGRSNPDPEADFDAFVERLGEVGRVAYHWAFGDVWARDELSRRDRSVVVIAILTALSRVDELAFHVPAGLNHGLTRIEIEEVMVQMTIYGGVPRAIEGTLAMQAAFAKIDARADAAG
jgi:4-carboxymuconolactone decarboxylase